MTGANYDVIPPSDFTIAKAPGEWNKGRIVVITTTSSIS